MPGRRGLEVGIGGVLVGGERGWGEEDGRISLKWLPHGVYCVDFKVVFVDRGKVQFKSGLK